MHLRYMICKGLKGELIYNSGITVFTLLFTLFIMLYLDRPLLPISHYEDVVLEQSIMERITFYAQKVWNTVYMHPLILPPDDWDDGHHEFHSDRSLVSSRSFAHLADSSSHQLHPSESTHHFTM